MAATTPAPPPSGDSATRHLLSALQQALDEPACRPAGDELAQLRLLQQRARIARASIARLIGDPQSDALDFMSEGDHILHQLADVPSA